jgi:hypothetical protein
MHAAVPAIRRACVEFLVEMRCAIPRTALRASTITLDRPVQRRPNGDFTQAAENFSGQKSDIKQLFKRKNGVHLYGCGVLTRLPVSPASA